MARGVGIHGCCGEGGLGEGGCGAGGGALLGGGAPFHTGDDLHMCRWAMKELTMG